MIDIHLLLKKLRRVEDDLEHLRTVSSQAGQGYRPDTRNRIRLCMTFPGLDIFPLNLLKVIKKLSCYSHGNSLQLIILIM
jgi:hypothetical protein